MNAPATFTQLPLGGTASTPPSPMAAAGGETASGIPDHPQYRRLFGLIRPDQVMVSVAAHLSPGGGGTGGSPGAISDPKIPASHPLCSSSAAIAQPDLYHVLDTAGHPSAASLASIAALRERHMAKGHTPAADAAHGPLFFKHKSDNAWHDAMAARLTAKRRQLLVIAAAILIAQIDALDFLAQQEPTP